MSSGKPPPRSASESANSRPAALDRELECGFGDLGLRVDRVLDQIMKHLAKAGRFAVDDGLVFGELQRHMGPQILVQGEHL